MTDNVTSTSDANFDVEVLQSTTPVLVDFWADWCGPCKAMQPALEEAAENYGADVKVIKLDIMANKLTAERFGVSSIPLFVLFDGGVERARITGAMSKTRLCGFIDSIIQGQN